MQFRFRLPKGDSTGDSEPEPGSRIFFHLSGVAFAAGFFVLLFARHWYDALPVWALATLIYYCGRRVDRKLRDARRG